MPLRAVTDHGIERVDRLVADDAGQAEQRTPKHRRKDSVARILGEAFDGGAGNAGLIQCCRIASDNLRHGHARTGETIQSFGDNGRTDLRTGMDDRDLSNSPPIQTNNPGRVFENLRAPFAK